MSLYTFFLRKIFSITLGLFLSFLGLSQTACVGQKTADNENEVAGIQAEGEFRPEKILDQGTTSCANGIKDSGEADVDCGGSCEAKCEPFKSCASVADCVTSFSQGGKTYTDIRCDDKVASFDPANPVALEKRMCVNEQLVWDTVKVAVNQRGGGVDSNRPVVVNQQVGDVVSDENAGSCSNGIKDSGEADVDCGGSCEAKCEPFKSCASVDDCATSFSQGGNTYTDIRCDETVASFDPANPVALEKRMCINEKLFWDAIQVAINQGAIRSNTGDSANEVKYLSMREGTPSLRWDSVYSRAHCPDDATVFEGSNDTRGSILIPNIDLAHTDFACVIKFSEAYPRPPTCVITGTGMAAPVEMTFKIHSVNEDLIEVKGQVNGGSGGVLAFNYICL